METTFGGLVSPSCRIPVLGERLKRHGTGAYGGPAQPHSISAPCLFLALLGPCEREFSWAPLWGKADVP